MMSIWETGFDLEDDDASRDLMLYCPRCKDRPDIKGPLCHHCGERTQLQGYCSVCEGYWHLPRGASCPKHDIALGERGASPLAYEKGQSAPDWVTVGRFPDSMAASVARSRLEAEGIPTSLSGERMGGQSMYLVATGGITLQVPRPMIADARILLDQSWDLPEDPEGLDDAWDELAPAPGEFRRTVMKGVIVLILVGPMILSLISVMLRKLSL